MGQRTALPPVVVSRVEIIEGYAPEKPEGPATDLLRCSVIDPQVAAAPTSIDATVRQDRMVAVDTLMSIANNKQVVWTLGTGHGPKQPESAHAKVLAFIDDDGCV